MKGLFYKEIRQFLSNKFTFIVIPGFFIVILVTIMDNSILRTLPLIAFLTAMFVINTQSEDDKFSFDSFVLASPISYKELILTKYIIMWSFALFNFILSIIILNFFTQQSTSQVILISFLILFTQTLFPCFLLSFAFKLGTQKAFTIFVPIFGLLPLIQFKFFATENIIIKLIKEQNFSNLKFILVMSLAIILINGISFFSSALIVKNKEY